MKIPSFVTDLSLPPWEYHRSLREWSKEIRTSTPIIWDDESAGWLAFRYEDVVRVQSDYATFSSEGTIKNRSNSVEGMNGGPRSIIEMDPPQHRQLRSLITQGFSARTVADQAPQIEKIVNELFDKVIAKGTEMNWMADLANPLPVIVIANMLGLPYEAWPDYKRWTDAIMTRSADMGQASMNFAQCFGQAIAEHIQNPKQDILSKLIESEVEGERLTFEDLMTFCFTLFIAGNITTTNVLGNAMLCFDQFPEELERLRQHPELITTAVEEVIRYVGPFRAGPNDLIEGRIAKMDVMLSDQLIRKGEQVQVNRLSANFDERQFPDPDRFDIGRTPNRHQTFGHGIHFCIGAPLARLEIKIVFETMLKRFNEMHIIKDKSLEQVPSLMIFGVKEVPLEFQPV